MINANTQDIMKAAKDLFEYRKGVAKTKDPADQHPMMYREYDWAKLPSSERVYYCDMATIVLISFGIRVPKAPSVAEITA